MITREPGLNFSIGFLMKRRAESIWKIFVGAMALFVRAAVSPERLSEEAEDAGSAGIVDIRVL
jgi:hypothetical protein